MAGDDLFMHSGGRAVVYKKGCAGADHEGKVTGEYAPDQQDDNCNSERDIKQKHLRAGQLPDFKDIVSVPDLNVALGFRKPAMQTCAAGLFLKSGKNSVGKGKQDAKDLYGKQCPPHGTDLNAQHSGRAHDRTGPGQQIHNAHGQYCDAKKCCLSHVHTHIHREHCRNHDAESGCTSAVQMGGQRHDGGDHGDADDVIPHQFHEFFNKDIEHARVCHDAEEKHRKNKKRRGGGGTGKAGLDHRFNVREAAAPSSHHCQRQQRWP